MTRARTRRTAALLAALAAALAGCALVPNFDALTTPVDAGPDARRPDDAALDGALDALDALDALSAPDAAPPSRYRTEVLADAPLLYFRFDAPESSPPVDEVPSGPSAAFEPNVTTAPPGAIHGENGRAAHFAGDGNAVVLAATSALDFPGVASFTLEAWIRPTIPRASFNYQRVLSYAHPIDEGYELVLHTQTGLDMGRTQGTSTCAVGLATDIVDYSRFHHVVITFDGDAGATITLYVDGAADGSGVCDVPLAFHDQLRVGATQFGTGDAPHAFAGEIDEVAVYDHVLTPTRVAAHYAAGLGQ